jgi:hypothetical protein
VPVLKGKTNDLKAFAGLPASQRAMMKPLFDQPFFGSGTNAVEQAAEFVERLIRFVPVDQPCFVDFYPLADDVIVPSGHCAIVHGFDALAKQRCCVTPTLGVERDVAVFESARTVVQGIGQGACLRVDVEALDGQADAIVYDVESRLAALGLPRAQCDVLLDLRTVARLRFSAADEILDFLAVLRQGGPFRSVILAGSSALLDVGVVPKDGHLHVARSELDLWDRIVFELEGSLVPVFGDYAVVNPEFFAEGARPNSNAKIRYTNGRRTTCFRGHGLKKPVKDYAQYRTLARQVMAQPYYDGPSFSAGDAYIAQVAAAPGPKGFGSLSSWVLADTNRHLAFVVRQMETRADRILAASTMDEVWALPA